MKNRFTIKFIAACAILVSANVVFAQHSHAGGHGDKAIGKPGVAAKVTRTVKVDMSDAMRFTPPHIAVKQGETIRFLVSNSGRLKHEMVLGSEKELKEHYQLMKKNPEMEHDEPNSVDVKPGKTGKIVWQFTTAGRVDFACLEPGHYDAGMKGSVTVAGRKPQARNDDHGDHKH